jgi:hypothetical protein
MHAAKKRKSPVWKRVTIYDAEISDINISKGYNSTISLSARQAGVHRLLPGGEKVASLDRN